MTVTHVCMAEWADDRVTASGHTSLRRARLTAALVISVAGAEVVTIEDMDGDLVAVYRRAASGQPHLVADREEET